MDTSHDISASPMIHNRSSTVEEEEDLRRQMTGIFGLIDKNNTGFISISQLEETIRELGSEATGDFMEFIQSFGAYMETINALGNDTVDVNKMDLDAFCKCTKNYMIWRRVRQLKRQDSTSFYMNQSQEMPTPNGRFRVSAPLLRLLHSKSLFPTITKHYTSYGEPYGTIGVDEFIAGVPNTHERELRMLINQLNIDRDGYYSLDEFFDDVGGLDGVVLSEEMLDEISLDNANSSGSATNLNGAESRQGTAMIRSMSRELAKVNSELERKCDAFQTEIQYLTVSVSKLEGDLQKKDKEIERLKKETKTVSVLQEAEKDFKTQITTLSNQLQKNNNIIEELRRQFNDERDKTKLLSDSLATKDEEVRKLTFTVKFQSTLQDKISALQQYIHEVEQELEKERDKVLMYKNSYFTAPRHLPERRDSEDRIPLYVRQSSFSASTPPLSVELLAYTTQDAQATQTAAHASQTPALAALTPSPASSSPSFPITKLNFSTPSPMPSLSSSNLNTPISPATAASPILVDASPSFPSSTSPISSSTPLPAPSSTSTPSNTSSPVHSRREVPPIPLNLTSTPPGSPSRTRVAARGSPTLSRTLTPSSLPISQSTPDQLVPPPPATPTTSLTRTATPPIPLSLVPPETPVPPPPATPTVAPTPVLPASSASTTAANAHYSRIPPAPLSPPTPSPSFSSSASSPTSIPLEIITTNASRHTPTTTTTTTTTTTPTNVFLHTHPFANAAHQPRDAEEDPALTSLRMQLWQLSNQLAKTERLLAESQSRLEFALAPPRLADSAWGLPFLKYFCPTGLFCTTHD